ncbi:F-box only protein 3 isoform X2 [Nematostella vectensis]|nr:F-box only protein 3 isoform X2 [Nematostella vectensis]
MADVSQNWLSCLSLDNLPTIPLASVLSYLNARDLARCSRVCRRFDEICSSLPSWKAWCENGWFVTTCPEEKTWKQVYIEQFMIWGKYEHCYTAIRRAWNQIEDFTRTFCPEIYSSLNPGLTETEISRIEERHLKGLSLPLDVKCSYRIHNGQRLVSPGLIGSMSISSHYQSESLLDLNVASSGLQHRDGLRNCLLISLCIYTGNGQFIALTDEEGHITGEIFWPSPDRSIIMVGSEVIPVRMHKFHSALCFTDWLTEFADKLANNCYSVINQEIFKFEFSSEATTEGITVRTTTSFLPELSSVYPPLFFFTYRISISMDENWPISKKCQLTTRHWFITQGDGVKTEVHGEGVVGLYPVMTPGAVTEYVSCTTFQTPTGSMEGYYVFKYLDNKSEEFHVRVPCMNFKSLPFVQAEDRIHRLGRIKLREALDKGEGGSSM